MSFGRVDGNVASHRRKSFLTPAPAQQIVKGILVVLQSSNFCFELELMQLVLNCHKFFLEVLTVLFLRVAIALKKLHEPREINNLFFLQTDLLVDLKDVFLCHLLLLARLSHALQLDLKEGHVRIFVRSCHDVVSWHRELCRA